jgi:hypothetical protein
MPTRNLLFTNPKCDNLQPTQLSTSVEHTESGTICHDTTNRLIDLEGISLEDGFGYTVTITGPPSTHKCCFRRRKSWKPSESNQDLERKEDDDPDQRLQIETTTTLEVDGAYRDRTSCARKQRPSCQIAPEVMVQEIEQASQNLSAWGLLDTPTIETALSQRLEPGREPPKSTAEEYTVDLGNRSASSMQ